MPDSAQSSAVVSVLRGDRLTALITNSNGELQRDIDKLWTPKGVITCGAENRFVVIFENQDRKRIVGLLKLIEVQTGKGKVVGSIHDVVVDEDFHGKGLGLLLMTTLLRYCKEKEFTTLELTCRPERVAANNLYKKVGFQMLASACEGGTNYYRYIF